MKETRLMKRNWPSILLLMILSLSGIAACDNGLLRGKSITFEVIDFNVLEIENPSFLQNNSNTYDCYYNDKVVMEFKIRNDDRLPVTAVCFEMVEFGAFFGISCHNEEWISCEIVDTEEYPVSIVTAKNVTSIFFGTMYEYEYTTIRAGGATLTKGNVDYEAKVSEELQSKKYQFHNLNYGNPGVER